METTSAYIERDCIIEHEGRKFESGGACFNGASAVAYMASDMRSVTSWHGEHLGSARVVSSWRMPHSWVSNRQYQVETIINGVVYTGRTMGGGMLWRGKRKA